MVAEEVVDLARVTPLERVGVGEEGLRVTSVIAAEIVRPLVLRELGAMDKIARNDKHSIAAPIHERSLEDGGHAVEITYIALEVGSYEERAAFRENHYSGHAASILHRGSGSLAALGLEARTMVSGRLRGPLTLPQGCFRG
jgi:hypothetical protein